MTARLAARLALPFMLLGLLCFWAAQSGFAEAADPAAEEPPLPALYLSTDLGEWPQDAYSPGELLLYAPDGSVSAQRMEIRLRGNTSRRFPKQSYRVKIVNAAGEKRSVSLCGLREDDDWILNPLYTDTSKIREALSYWLWEKMNSCGKAAASSRLAFVEVYLNGAYHGLYALQERVDRKQVGGDREKSILYKATANDIPTAEELLSCQDPAVCRGLELAYRGRGAAQSWLPAAGYIGFLSGEASWEEARLSLENAIDYGLWAMLTQARDCHFKNQYIHCVYREDGYVLHRIPWDVNHTLGDLWNGKAKEQNYSDYAFLSLTQDDVFTLLAGSGDMEIYAMIEARWKALRSSVITEESILGHARALHDLLYPAIERDTQRWPQCGMGEGNAANIRDIEAYIQDILPRMDAWVSALTEETEMDVLGKDLDR